MDSLWHHVFSEADVSHRTN